MPIDPTFAVSGADWQIGSVEGAQDAPAAPGFDGALAQQIGRLSEVQQDAEVAARDLASGTATDPAATVMAIEHARLSMQLAGQIRTKGLEAFQEVFRTSV
ncbi:MAG: flagellar hook-basal body complex protein FliE [Solirubrobacteraceae bacterium]|jgi:flagellar hook-basal body complex protein FliE|nr:flagellar hook-basal body complex protein FliE [Solirubrobacteraceae bacterium]